MVKQNRKKEAQPNQDGYLSSSIDELKKVSYPTAQETTQASIVTVIFVIFFALTLALFDLVFKELMQYVI